MEWVKNIGQKPDMKFVDVKLNEDEPDWPGIECVRYHEDPNDWEWTRGIGSCEITHYRESSNAELTGCAQLETLPKE